MEFQLLRLRNDYFGVCDIGSTAKLFSCQGCQASVSFTRASKRRRRIINANSFAKLDAPSLASQLVRGTSKSDKITQKNGLSFQVAVYQKNDSETANASILSGGTVGAGMQRNRRFQATATDTDTYINFLKEYEDEQDLLKAGGSEINFVRMQASKDLRQVKISERLEPLIGGEEVLDLVVIGCGPAGLSLAAEAAKKGLDVGIIGPDLPFTNNYGVWRDEFADLGLENCIEHVWKDTAVYLRFDNPLLIKRAYCRVSRHLLREELLKRCAEAGVKYMESKVERITEKNEKGSIVCCGNGASISCRLVTAASGAASGKFLNYEPGAPGICVQTAYGAEIEVEHSPFDPETMVFMDYRNYRRQELKSAEKDADVPPTFLYVMPLSPTRIFVEETCLAARPAMPFSLLKERLHIRLKKMGINVVGLYEEEWSYIPVGGSLPDTMQQHLGFGAAASMVHPATGYSVVRSLSEAPSYAAAIASALRSEVNKESVIEPVVCARDAALKAWDALWPKERKKQRAFFLFGLELMLQLDLDGTRMFFETFFQLPEWMWKGFLASRLSSIDLIWFACATFIFAPTGLRYRLVRHLMKDPSGAYLMRTYTRLM